MSSIDKNIGKRFYDLTILKNGDKRGYCVAACSCGNKKQIYVYDILSGKTKSCGCLNSKVLVQRNKKHGHTGTRIYKIWKGMIKRCKNRNSEAYELYGGRGINVCERWLIFDNFFNDMSPTYKNELSIDRIDNEKSYSPENCRWATNQQQANNRRNNVKYNYKGKMMTISEISDCCGVSVSLLRSRLSDGWNIIDSVNVPKLKTGGNNRSKKSYAMLMYEKQLNK